MASLTDEDKYRIAQRELEIRRLDSLVRPLLVAYFQTQGDIVANDPDAVGKALLFLLQAYCITHGATGKGVTGETTEEMYQKVQDVQIDLSDLLETKEQLRKNPKVWELRYYIIPTLRRLEEKWSKKNRTNFKGNPSLLENAIIREIKNIEPDLICQIATVVGIESRGGFGGNPFEQPKSFRILGIDGTNKREG